LVKCFQATGKGAAALKERIKTILLWAVAVVLLGGCLLILWRTGFFEAARSEAGIRAYIESRAPWSHLTFFFLQLMSVIVAPIPSNVTALAGGLLFGTVPAFLITWAAVILGSLAVFFLARALGQSFAARFVGRKLSARYLDVIRRKRDSFLFLAFLFPFFPDDILCILAGVTEVSWKRFLLLCLIARPWGLLVSCAVGGSALELPLWAMLLLGLLGGAVFVLAMIYGDRIEEKLVEKFRH